MKSGMVVAGILSLLSTAVVAEEIKVADETKKEGDKKADGTAVAATGAKPKEWKAARFDGSIVVLDQSLGLGSFVSNEFARNTLYSMSLDLQPKFNLTEKIYLYGRLIFSKELTNSFSTSTTDPGQVTLSDLIVDLGYSKIWEPAKGLKFSGSLRTFWPTSLASRFANLVVAVAPGFSVGYKIGKLVDLTYAFRFRKNLNTTDSPTIKANDNLAPVRSGGAEQISADQTAIGGNSVSFSLTNTFIAGFNFTDKLTLSLTLFLINSFAYSPRPLDDTSAPAATGGRGQRDSTWGVIDLSYSITDHWGLSAGISSYQSAKTSDGQSIRFPFFDFRSFADNNTSFYFDVSYTF